MSHVYGAGALPTASKNIVETFTAQNSNGTSSLNTGGQINVEIDCLWTDRFTNTPDYLSPYPSIATFLLVNIKREQRPLGMCHISLTYQTSYTSLPATQYTEQNGTMEEDIVNHPNFDDWAAFEIFDENGVFLGFVRGYSKYGQSSYLVGSRIVTVKEYFTSKPADQSAHIGKTSSPGSDYTGSWLIIGSNRALESTYWSRTTTYRFSAQTWDAQIYPSA